MKAKAFMMIPHSNRKSTAIEWMVAPLVMCCDCKHYDGDNYCMKNGLIVRDDGRWFCADGEEEENNETD